MKTMNYEFDDLRLSRRAVLGLVAAGTAHSTAGIFALARSGDGKVPITGNANAALEPFDSLMTTFVAENKVPGAALAVTHGGKLVYARGFGYADVENKVLVAPAAFFRIASVSKPITATAVLQLIEQGKLGLDDHVVDHLKVKPFTGRGAKPDQRWKQITVRHCLQHRGGWDRDKSYDPVARAAVIARALGIKPPVTPTHVVRYMMGQPLDFDPGQRYAYSNLGYLVLGRIIEAITGEKYEAHVKKTVFAPLGIMAARLGRALAEHREKGEVRYYDAKKRTGPSLYPPHVGQKVPIQYGGDNFEAYEAHGGWLLSAVELVKFAAAFDDPARCPLLSARSIKEMWARPEGAAGAEADGKPKAAYYGCGWNVRPIGTTGKANLWHGGYIAGSEAWLVRRFDGLNWAVLFNTDHNPSGQFLVGLIDGQLHAAADKVKAWPGSDQFARWL